jgi:hypothetical protein
MYSKGKHDCPRGFEWSKSKNECVPERLGVEDKLTLKSERYFFKDEVNKMTKSIKEETTCSKGFVWCPNQKKCIPAEEQRSKGQGKGKGFGQGKGPVGVPKNEELDQLVDEVFDGGFSQFGKIRKSEKQIDMILDNVRPYDHPLKMKVKPSDVKVDVDESETAAKDDDPKKISNDINHIPDQDAGDLLKSVHGELSEAQLWRMIAEMRINEDYKSYFSSMLKKHGYSSPAEIPADKKKEFFNAIDRGWKGKKEDD